jgi:hypothetical protein
VYQNGNQRTSHSASFNSPVQRSSVIGLGLSSDKSYSLSSLMNSKTRFSLTIYNDPGIKKDTKVSEKINGASLKSA